MSKQKTQVKQKTDLVQKLVIATGIFCTFVLGVSFAAMFNAGVNGINRQFIRERIKLSEINFYQPNINNLDNTNPISIRVASVRHTNYISGYTFPDHVNALINEVQTTINEVGDVVDIILTPEYTLTPGEANANYIDYAIDFSCDSNFDNCSMSSGGGMYSDLVFSTIETLRLLATENQFNLYLGTVVERVDTSTNPIITDPYVYYNILVIINPQGEISIKRKAGSDFYPWGIYGSPEWQEKQNLALATIRSFTVINRNSESFTTLPMICGESFDEDVLEYALNLGIQDIDLLIYPERQGDIQFQIITEAIQNGTWSPTMGYGWDWGIEDVFIEEYINSGLLRSNAYLVMSDSGFTQAGIINLVNPPAAVTEYQLNDTYMYGLIQYCDDGTIEEQCSTDKPKYCLERELIDNCSECGCPTDVPTICQSDETCKKIYPQAIPNPASGPMQSINTNSN